MPDFEQLIRLLEFDSYDRALLIGVLLIFQVMQNPGLNKLKSVQAFVLCGVAAFGVLLILFGLFMRGIN